MLMYNKNCRRRWLDLILLGARKSIQQVNKVFSRDPEEFSFGRASEPGIVVEKQAHKKWK